MLFLPYLVPLLYTFFQHNFTTVFPLGLSDSENVNNDVKKEHKKYGDILQSDFLDTYGNLTLKVA